MNISEEIKNAGEIVGTLPNVIDSALIGSAYYLPNPTDIDIAILVDSPNIWTYEYDNFIASGVPNEGWHRCSEYDKPERGIQPTWTSVRRGNLNFMMTVSKEFFDGYVTAMEVCKALNLTEKTDRIKVCQIVRDKKKASEV